MLSESRGDQIDVWIVNDSNYMTQLLSDLISVNNIQVSETARDGAEALRKLATKKPDVIPITKGSNGDIIANAYVTPDQVSIVINDHIGLNPETPDPM